MYLRATSIILFGGALLAQTIPGEIPQTTIRAATRMVVVDVIVTNKSGNPVTGLQAGDFSLNEEGKLQKLAAFHFEANQPTPKSRTVSELPPHVFTNRPSFQIPAGPPTVVLLDGLNTPLRDQIYARQQLLKYLRTQLLPDQHVAVFALTNRLHLLQDFTSDPELLRTAVDRFLAHDSRELQIEREGTDPDAGHANALSSPVAAALREMLLERAAVAYGARVSETLAAFRTIAGVVSGFPGRKNLVWISGGFPLVFVVDSSLSAESAQRIFVDRSMHEETRRTLEHLAQAQVAVYPVDARGLVGATAEDASAQLKDEMGHVHTSDEFARDVSRSTSGLLASQSAMEEITAETGGTAYMNQNEIDHAVALSLADGSSYYSLAYYPTDKNWSGKFRAVQVKVDRAGMRLRYRRGYYAIDRTDVQQGAGNGDRELSLALQGDFVPATAVVFDARIVPPAPAASVTVPIEFLVDSRTIVEELVEDGKHRFDLDFHVGVLSADGKLVAHVDQRINASARAEEFERVQRQGLPFRISVALPSGRYRLRLIVRDRPTGLMGSLEVPLVLDRP